MKAQKDTLLRGNKKSTTLLKRLSVFSALLILLLRCDSVDNLSPEQTKHPYVVSLDEALQVASKYDLSNKKTKETQSLRIVANEVDKKETITDENKNPLFHVINYAKEGGFLIVSADLRTMPVLAYSDKGNFETKEIPSGVKEWFDESKKQIKDVKKANKDINPVIAKVWKKYLSGELNLPKTRSGRLPFPGEENMCISSSSSAGPFINTNWGQGGIATALLGTSSGCNYCNKYNAGCGPVALAQIMRYYQKPNWFTYDGMPDNYSRFSCGTSNAQEYELSRLMVYCGSASGLNSSYGYWGTCNTFSWPSNIPSAFGNFGYSNSGSSNSMDYQVMNNELYGGHPVILWGTTAWIGNFEDYHIWICDGVNSFINSEYDYETHICNQWGFTYYHMNWGWHGDWNGFYGISDFSPGSQGNYNTNMHMINGIRP